jgi:F420-dependent oxidoreductase-like protein
VGIKALTKAKFGVFLPFYALRNRNQPDSLFDQLKNIVLECEHFGYDSVWLDDHLMYGNTPILESWTTLSALASATSRIRLGIMVTSNAFRNPALLAKMAATVDIICNGRLNFGIGAGIQKEEHDAYGFPFLKPTERIGRMKETVEILKKMWTHEKTSYKGKYYHIEDAICEPKPRQKPHPPITIGGSGEKYALKVTAQYADRFDFGYQPTLEGYKHKLCIFESHCKMVGRSFAEIEKSCWPAGQILLAKNREEVEAKVRHLKPKNLSREEFENFTFAGTPDALMLKLQAYLDLDVTQFMLFFGDLPDLNGLKLLAEAF